jgi:hypothetical protein
MEEEFVEYDTEIQVGMNIPSNYTGASLFSILSDIYTGVLAGRTIEWMETRGLTLNFRRDLERKRGTKKIRDSEVWSHKFT